MCYYLLHLSLLYHVCQRRVRLSLSRLAYALYHFLIASSEASFCRGSSPFSSGVINERALFVRGLLPNTSVRGTGSSCKVCIVCPSELRQSESDSHSRYALANALSRLLTRVHLLFYLHTHRSVKRKGLLHTRTCAISPSLYCACH